MFDYVAIVERAAIKEFDGGMNRFQAETEAAAEVGKKRWEVFSANNKRNSQQGRDSSQSTQRNAKGDLSPVQPHKAQQAGQMSIGDLQTEWNSLVLLALPISGWGVL